MKLFPIHTRSKTIFRDLGSDILVSLSLTEKGNRFKKGENTINDVKRKYPSYSIVLTGHSLGGSIARELSRKYKYEAHIFEAGSSPIDIAKDIIGRDEQEQITSHINPLDPIAISGITQKNNVVIEKPTIANVHSIRQFTKK